MKDLIRKSILKVVNNLWKEVDLDIKEIEINIAPEKFGDYSTNVAMKLAGILKKNPLEIAKEIAENILEDTEIKDLIEKTEAVRPGFVNFYFSQELYKKVLADINKKGDEYGFSDLGAGKKVMVEFGQPNTHKAITIGHLKSAVSGLAVVKLFEALGYEVIKANFFGDVGMHVAKSTWGFMQEKLPVDFEEWTSHQKMQFVNDAYVSASNLFKDDPETEKQIRQVNKDIYRKVDNDNYQWYQKIREWSIDHQNEVFAKLGIEYDRQYPESEVCQDAIEIVKKNQNKIFEKSQGAIIYNGKKDGLNTWVFQTKEGNPTYSAKDLALATRKFSEYDLDLAIVTTSVEQSDYFRAIIKVLGKIDEKFKGKYKHIPFGWLLMGGKKTSSRMGRTIKCVEILEEAQKLAEEKIAVDKDYSKTQKQEIIDKVALSGLKFLILSHEFHKDINYNPNEFIKLNGFSGPFILYSYVRINSMVKKIGEVDSANLSLKEGDLNGLNFEEEQERQLAGALVMYGDVVLRAGTEIAPHIICNYLYEVAQKFNSFYEHCPIQKADNLEQKKSRLLLAKATGQILKNGLGLLGIETLEKM